MTPPMLVIGGLGFIGSHFVRAWSTREPVTVLDNMAYGSPDNLGLAARRSEVIEGDVRDAALIDRLVRDHAVVVNFACVHMMDSLTDPHGDLQVNAEGTLRCLEACRAHQRRYVHISSGSVYGTTPTVPTEETHTYLVGVNTPYAISKAMGDAYALLFHHRFGVPAIVIRPYFVYGTGGWNVVSRFVRQAVAGEPLTVHGDGRQTRTPTHVTDVVGGIIQAIDKEVWGEAINLAGTLEIDILSMGEQIIRRSGTNSSIKFVSDVPVGPRRVVPSIQKACRLLGYEPRVAFEDGVEAMIAAQRALTG